MLHLFELKIQYNSNIVKFKLLFILNMYNISRNLFLWGQSWIFIIITSVSHDSSEIILICWFAAQETFRIIINVEYSCAVTFFYFLQKLWFFFQKCLSWMERSEERNLFLNY